MLPISAQIQAPAHTENTLKKYIFQVENVYRRHYYNTGDSAKCLKVFLVRSFVTIFDKYPSFKYLTNGSIKTFGKCVLNKLYYTEDPPKVSILFVSAKTF